MLPPIAGNPWDPHAGQRIDHDRAVWSRSRLRAFGLGAIRGARVLFRSVDLELSPGEILELRGPNGSGKSTLLRILAGLTRPEAGEIRIECPGLEAPAHFLGHLDAIKPGETVREQARFWARFYGRPATEAERALERVGLGTRMAVPGRGLSAGQRRRLALSRLLIEPRPFWLLDEPSASLDADGRALLEKLVAEHTAWGGIVVAAIHGDGFAGARTFNLADAQRIVA